MKQVYTMMHGQKNILFPTFKIKHNLNPEKIYRIIIIIIIIKIIKTNKEIWVVVRGTTFSRKQNLLL